MIFNYNICDQLKRPHIYIASPNKKYLGTLQCFELLTELLFNGISQVTFTVYNQNGSIIESVYDDVVLLNLIEVENIGWFQITNIKENNNGVNKSKEVTALSLENELTTKTLNSFGSMGISTDEQAGLDRYCLYNATDVSHSILHIIVDKIPTWKIGYVDPSITTEYRSFNNDSVDAYSFLTGDVSTAFECIFQFDTYERSISAYTLSSIGQDTGIYLAYRNIVDKIDIDTNMDNLVTVMSVSGGDNEGSTLGIIEINPNGTNEICDYSYYYNQMSQELKDKLVEYEEVYESKVETFNQNITTLKRLQDMLYEITDNLPDVEHSKDWTLYGLNGLKDELDYYTQKMSLYLDGKNETERLKYYNIINDEDGLNDAIELRQLQYDDVMIDIENQKAYCESIKLPISEFLGTELFKELSLFEHDGDFTDDSYVVTSIMTDSEILDMQTQLMNAAKKELKEKCKPCYTMNLTPVNFITIPEFQDLGEKIKLGDYMTIELDDQTTITSRLLKISLNWDSYDNFSLTFCSKDKLEEGWVEFSEIQSQINQTSNTVKLNGTGWSNAKNQTSTVNAYMKNALDTSKQKLINSKDEEFIISSSGTQWRKKLTDKDEYSPRQMWGTGNGLYLTEDGWQNVSVAIGELDLGDGTTSYGVAAPMLIGTTILGERFKLSNSNNTFTMNENGLTISNGTNEIRLNPNEVEMFQILKGNEKNFYVDSDGNLNLSGNISSSKVSGSTILGGNININDKFKVDTEGNVTLPSSATISFGQITDGDSSVTSITNSAISTANIRADQIDTDNLTVKFVNAHGQLSGVDYNADRDMTLDIHGGRLVCYSGTDYNSAQYRTSIIDSGVYAEYIHTNNIAPRSGGTLNIQGYAKLSDIPDISSIPSSTADINASYGAGYITFKNGIQAAGYSYVSGLESRIAALEKAIK